jgi:hypothetical protein
MSPKLHIMSHCGKDWLVGIDGKDIRSSKIGSGNAGDVPFISIGNDEIEHAPRIKSSLPCKICGQPVELKVVGE